MHRFDLPSPSLLRTFEVSARHLSFTAAAIELNLSQAAVSKQIKLLEHQLREALFVRSARSLALTKAGEAYLPKVRDAFERLADGTHEVFGARRADVLTVRVAVGFAVNWLALRLPGFVRAYPHIPLRIISSVWNEGEEEGFDLDIRYGDGTWPGEFAERLTTERVIPVCSSAMAEQLETVDDLGHHTLIHVLGYRDGWALWLKTVGARFDNDRPGFQVDNSVLAFALAGQGMGIALGRSSMIGPDLAAGKLVTPFQHSVAVEEGFYLIRRQRGPHVEVFRAWLLENAKQQATLLD